MPSWYVEWMSLCSIYDDGGRESADSTRDRSRLDICSHSTSDDGPWAMGHGPDEQRLVCGWACDCDSAGPQGLPRAPKGDSHGLAALGCRLSEGVQLAIQGVVSIAASLAPSPNGPRMATCPLCPRAHTLTLSSASF